MGNLTSYFYSVTTLLSSLRKNLKRSLLPAWFFSLWTPAVKTNKQRIKFVSRKKEANWCSASPDHASRLSSRYAQDGIVSICSRISLREVWGLVKRSFFMSERWFGSRQYQRSEMRDPEQMQTWVDVHTNTSVLSTETSQDRANTPHHSNPAVQWNRHLLSSNILLLL